MPFMDHWNVSQPHISLRDIIKEEQALQDMDKVMHSFIYVNTLKYSISVTLPSGCVQTYSLCRLGL